jgi:hypothetical protein
LNGRRGRQTEAKQDLNRARLALAIAGLAIGCGGPPAPRHYPGASSATAAAQPASRLHTAPPPRRWEHYDEVLSWPPAQTAFPSLGHFAANQSAAIHVDGAARETYVNLVAASRLPVGTIVAELLSDMRTGRRGRLLAMHKLAADRWEYLVVDAAGLIEERGDLPLCRRCHADGLADQLFGLPRRAE